MELSTNRAFQEMLRTARERILQHDPIEIAQNAQITFHSERSEFSVTSLGIPITIHYPDCTFTPELDPWHQLTILHYMDLSDGTLPSSELILFSQLQDGFIRGSGFDRQCEERISHQFGNLTVETLENACKTLGAIQIPSNADFCAVFPFLPYYPVTLKIWFADDELPGSGRMFLQKNADHNLTAEDAVTAGELILNLLSENITPKL